MDDTIALTGLVLNPFDGQIRGFDISWIAGGRNIAGVAGGFGEVFAC